MKEREEFLLGLSDRVYIGNRPAEPGIYDRYWITEINGKKHITLRRLDCTTEEFDPQITPVFLEYRPRRRHSTDTIIEEGENVFDTDTWSKNDAPPGIKQFSELDPLDRYRPDIFKPKLCDIGTLDDRNFTILTTESLEKMGSPGVLLNNRGQKDYCPTEKLIYILVDRIHHQLVICRKDPQDRSRYSTYSLSKITSIRFSPKKK